MSDPEDRVVHIAEAAGLPLPAERVGPLAVVFETWMAASTELCRKMAEPEHLEVTPVTVFQHPSNPVGE
jgi:hypothetical protein